MKNTLLGPYLQSFCFRGLVRPCLSNSSQDVLVPLAQEAPLLQPPIGCHCYDGPWQGQEQAHQETLVKGRQTNH